MQSSLELLADALRERLRIIADRSLREENPQQHLEQLKVISEKIIFLQSQLPDDIHPHLRHYLQNCSYDKALAMLQ